MTATSAAELALALLTASIVGEADTTVIVQTTIAERFASVPPRELARFVDEMIGHLTAVAAVSLTANAETAGVDAQQFLQFFAAGYLANL